MPTALYGRFLHRVGLVASIQLATCVQGCEKSELPAGPLGQLHDDRPLATGTDVGPAPLRRLSDAQYLYALEDLFPGLEVAVPELPPEGTARGFDNAASGQTASDVRIARYEEIARAYAQAATADVARRTALVGCDPTQRTVQACATMFVTTQGARIFRRPLDAAEISRFTLRFERYARLVDFEAAIELTLTAMLQSPQFLYRLETENTSRSPVLLPAYEMASRLSLLIWQSAPDETLLNAASHDELKSKEQVTAQVRRLLQDERAKRMFWDFHRQWLSLDHILEDEHGQRTPAVDPDWTARRQKAAAMETRLFVEHVASEEGTLAALLNSRRAFVNRDLAAVYGVLGPGTDDSFREVELPAEERAGVLTRIAFLAATSHRGATSPPIRGNAVSLGLLCRLPAAPPPGVDTTPPVLMEGEGPKTNRTLFEERTSAEACHGCHLPLNGLGFGFEHYNASGAFAQVDNGLPVSAKGMLVGTDVDGPFDGAIALSKRLSESELIHRCAVQNWLLYALGRELSPEEGPLLEELSDRFFEQGGDLESLLVSIATADTFRMLPGKEQP